MESAICAGRSMEVYDSSTLPQPPQSANYRREARLRCEGCMVLEECAAYAVETRAAGVIMAGVPLGDSKNSKLYAELRVIAGKGVCG